MESITGATTMWTSDSGYSNSCGNTHSRKSASSKSKHSESNSGGSSGYCGAGTADAVDPNLTPPIEEATATADGTPDVSNRTAKGDKTEHKKKKLKSVVGAGHSDVVAAITEATTTTNVTTIAEEDTAPQAVKEPVVDTKIAESPLEMTDGLVEKEVQAAAAPSWNKSADQPHVQEVEEPPPKTGTAPPPATAEKEASENKTMTSQPENGFCCVISMYDGVVLYTTANLTAVLGFPKDMWLGRSFIDFVHPKDRETFTSQVTTGIALPLVDAQRKYKDYKNSLYVCLRKYRGLKSSGFGVVDKGVSYQAFQLTVKFKYVSETEPENKCLDVNSGMFLVIVAIPLYTCYKVPGERKKSMKFGMRHTASCTFSHVDPDVVTNFGFLPQDMLGKSVFDFYHPEDMPFLKEIYKSVMQMCHTTGSVFRSKPYRFAVQNGGFAMIETEWSSFVNPWSRRLEFVIGLYRVLEGPPNPDIFEACSLRDTENLPEEVIEESKLIKGEILLLLNKELPRPTEAAKHEVSKRCKDLANFMETLIDEVSLHQLELPPRINATVSERDFVMLGEISPHHDYYDSKSSSETPPSYNQLNYNENLQRFFESKPKTTVSDESAGSSGVGAMMQTDSCGDSDAKPATSNHHQQDCQNTPQNDAENNRNKCLSPMQNSGDMSGSGSASAENMSSASNPNMETANSLTIVSKDSYKPLHLTKSLLSRHNEDMEKIMLKKHREQRFSTKENKKSHTNNYHHNHTYHYNYKTEKLNALERANVNHRVEHASPAPAPLPPSGAAHGVKRCGSYSPECATDNQHKISKHRYKSGVANQKEDVGQSSSNHNGAQQVARQQPNIYKNQHQVHKPMVRNGEMSYQAGLNEVNLWPPFSVAAAPLQSTQACMNSTPIGPGTPGGFTTAGTAGVLPVYYLPTPSTQRKLAGTTPYSDPTAIINAAPRYQVQYMPGLFYNHGAAATPTLYPSSTMLCPTMPMMPMSIPLLSTSMRTPTNPQLQMNGHANAAVLQNNGSSGQRGAVTNQYLAAQIDRKVTDSVVSGSQRFQGPASQATSVKVEPGSAISSIASASLTNKCVTKQRESELQQQLDAKNNSTTMDESSSCYSSSYSSFLKTDTGTGSGSNDDYNPVTAPTACAIAYKADQKKQNMTRKKAGNGNSRSGCQQIRNKEPPWLESVQVSHDLVYRYQMAVRDIEDILRADLDTLKEFNQPVLVNDQLSQLYLDMELEGLSQRLTLEEGITSSSSSGEDATNVNSNMPKAKKKRKLYSSSVMIYEEDAPLPSPTENL
ncbi:unnamed protein product [Callosobruchus maculatus]|uniref:Period circadian protein n=1 Tax=Callosobruchus maculatus TaxID=64391 RepID=A0A653CPE8_CALMS|nr:unnamed protein product [Callosobruchus maculatus]